MASVDTSRIDNSAQTVLQKQTAKRRLAHRLFNTEDGQQVYEWLMDQFYHNQHAATDECKLSRHAGRRDVMILLRKIVENDI